MNPLFLLTHFLFPLAFAFSPEFDIHGRVKDITHASVVIEAHGKTLAIPRRAFEQAEHLKIGLPAKARVQMKDLRQIRY